MRQRVRCLVLLAPLLMAGCGTLTGSSATSAAGGGTASANQANGTQPWLVTTRGSATPTPTYSSGVPPYPTSTATGFLPVVPRARVTPRPTCSPATVHFSQIKSLAVVPGTTTATASWYNVGGYNLVEYRLTAISQDLRSGKQRDVGWVTAKPAGGCGTMTATITGLDRATNYVLSLDAVVTRVSGDGTHAGTLQRSPVVRTK